jgi:hypothetical protein
MFKNIIAGLCLFLISCSGSSVTENLQAVRAGKLQKLSQQKEIGDVFDYYNYFSDTLWHQRNYENNKSKVVLEAYFDLNKFVGAQFNDDTFSKRDIERIIKNLAGGKIKLEASFKNQGEKVSMPKVKVIVITSQGDQVSKNIFLDKENKLIKNIYANKPADLVLSILMGLK